MLCIDNAKHRSSSPSGSDPLRQQVNQEEADPDAESYGERDPDSGQDVVPPDGSLQKHDSPQRSKDHAPQLRAAESRNALWGFLPCLSVAAWRVPGWKRGTTTRS